MTTWQISNKNLIKFFDTDGIRTHDRKWFGFSDTWQREISKNPKSCENLKTSWNFSAKKFFSENCKNHVFSWFNGFFYKKWQKYFCFDMPTTFPNIFSKNALGNLNSVYLPNFSVILFFKQNFTFAFFFSYKKHDKSYKIVWKILPDKWIYLSGFWELSGFFLRLSGYFWFKKNWYLLLQYSWLHLLADQQKYG
jgi:hypothetical protein